jgi:hypothetical protein
MDGKITVSNQARWTLANGHYGATRQRCNRTDTTVREGKIKRPIKQFFVAFFKARLNPVMFN